MMQFDLQTAADGGRITLPLWRFLQHLKYERRLRPLLLGALVSEMLLTKARHVGLSVGDNELQQAADGFRRRHGLNSAAGMQAWLARERLSVREFESTLENSLLIDRLKEFLTRDCIAGHFAKHTASYARARFQQIVVEREELARELLSQIREEGRGFGELARAHSRLADHQVEVYRAQLFPAAAEAIFATGADTVAGPIAGPEGFYLFQVEALYPAELEEATTARIREVLFTAWIQEQLRKAPPTFPLLEALG